jgi:hypothetical protein
MVFSTWLNLWYVRFELLVDEGGSFSPRIEQPNNKQQLEDREGGQEEQQQGKQPIEGSHETKQNPVSQPLFTEGVVTITYGLREAEVP